MKASKGVLPICVIAMSLAAAARPSWMNGNTVERTGGSVLIQCEGRDISRDLAYQQALHRCNSLAAEQFKSANFNLRSIMISSENDSPKLYEETSSNWQVDGLAPQTQHEFTETVGHEFVTTLQVRYDLGKATVSPILNKKVDAEPSLLQGSVAEIISDQRANQSSIEAKKFAQSNQRTFIITSIPRCENILVSGALPRSLKCTANPMAISVNPGEDTELLIRAKGYKPAKVILQHDRTPAASHETESIEVTLAPL